jgi:1-acyl-sn-glycerol-3-phosphate acyltransferase
MHLCPERGPVLMAANHLSYLDVPLDGAWSPRPVLYFSKMEVKRWPLIGALGSLYGTIYVRRGEADRQAVREALGALAAGQVLNVYPEGHRSHGRGLLRAQPGIALLAQRSGAPVWPVAVTGSEHIGKQLRPRVTVTGGQPFDPLAAAREVHGPAPTHQQVADTIMRRIAGLLPEHYRGVYA